MPPSTILIDIADAESNTKIKDIPVGTRPVAIDFDENTNRAYVVDAGDISKSVAVIDGLSLTKIGKDFNAGYIECKDQIKAPLAQQFYIFSDSGCTAKPYQGFEFVSWQENLGRNSTQLISIVPQPSPLDSILNFLRMNPDKPEAKFNTTKFGSFTANFRTLLLRFLQNMWIHCLLLLLRLLLVHG